MVSAFRIFNCLVEEDKYIQIIRDYKWNQGRADRVMKLSTHTSVPFSRL